MLRWTRVKSEIKTLVKFTLNMLFETEREPCYKAVQLNDIYINGATVM